VREVDGSETEPPLEKKMQRRNNKEKKKKGTLTLPQRKSSGKKRKGGKKSQEGKRTSEVGKVQVQGAEKLCCQKKGLMYKRRNGGGKVWENLLTVKFKCRWGRDFTNSRDMADDITGKKGANREKKRAGVQKRKIENPPKMMKHQGRGVTRKNKEWVVQAPQKKNGVGKKLKVRILRQRTKGKKNP